MTRKKPITLVLVDDHQLILEGLKATLTGLDDVRVIGEAADGEEALQVVAKKKPNLVLMDINLPKMNGIEATRQILRRFPATKVLILSMHESVEYVRQIVGSGASGYLLKDASRERLVDAIRKVAEGETAFSARVAKILLGEGPERSSSSASGTGKPRRKSLSAREREILVLIADGLSSKEIANLLKLSVRTVQTHREHIMRKLDIHSASGLTKYVYEHRLRSR